MLLFFDKVVKYNKIRKIPPEYKTTIVKINQFFKKNMLTIIDTKIKIINNNRALNIGSKKITNDKKIRYRIKFHYCIYFKKK